MPAPTPKLGAEPQRRLVLLPGLGLDAPCHLRWGCAGIRGFDTSLWSAIECRTRCALPVDSYVVIPSDRENARLIGMQVNGSTTA
jgi:hypothetical protein